MSEHIDTLLCSLILFVFIAAPVVLIAWWLA